MSGLPQAEAFEGSPRSPGSVAPIALLVLCAIGAAVSGLSTWDHVRFRVSGGTQAGACAAVARSLHPTACLAARGAICAQVQGRFWQYAEGHFAIQEPRSRELIFATAQSVGLAMDRFGECLDAEQTKRALAEDVALSQAVGVRATPTVLVNGRFYEGAILREQLATILNDTKPCGCDRCSDDGACATATIAASAGPESQ